MSLGYERKITLPLDAILAEPRLENGAGICKTCLSERPNKTMQKS